MNVITFSFNYGLFEVSPGLLFSVFMWHNHIPKLNITFPSEVLVLSDKRPCRNLTFHNVLALQGSYCNRACLNFQAFALRDMKIETREGCRIGQKMSYLFICFSVTLRPPCLCPSEGHKHGVSIQSSINFGDKLLQIMHKWKTAETWFFARLFIYQSSIISLTLDFFIE